MCVCALVCVCVRACVRGVWRVGCELLRVAWGAAWSVECEWTWEWRCSSDRGAAMAAVNVEGNTALHAEYDEGGMRRAWGRCSSMRVRRGGKETCAGALL